MREGGTMRRHVVLHGAARRRVAPRDGKSLAASSDRYPPSRPPPRSQPDRDGAEPWPFTP